MKFGWYGVRKRSLIENFNTEVENDKLKVGQNKK